jgi:hypothetical protein
MSGKNFDAECSRVWREEEDVEVRTHVGPVHCAGLCNQRPDGWTPDRIIIIPGILFCSERVAGFVA